MDKSGAIPSLDYIDGVDDSAETKFTQKHLDRFVGLLSAIRFGGPNDLRGSSSFKSFIGVDSIDAMCELRIVADQGHRFLCFQKAGMRFVVACGFVKPPQHQTPPEHKTRARQILSEYTARIDKRRR